MLARARQVASGKVSITWTDNTGEGDAQATDKAMPLVFNISKEEALYNTASTARSSEAAELTFPADWVGDTVHIYLGFISADGSAVATSLYLGEKTVV